jgi:regulation of enolase protein 1 (concanavalin A-like superfamily)
MLIFIGVNGNATLFQYDKSTKAVTKLGELLDATSKGQLSGGSQNGSGWYFSATLAKTVYLDNTAFPYTVGSSFNATKRKLYRYDLASQNPTLVPVFDINDYFTNVPGATGDKYITQEHSSNDDKVHSASVLCPKLQTASCSDGTRTATFPHVGDDLTRAAPDEIMGCIVYDESVSPAKFLYFPRQGDSIVESGIEKIKTMDECHVDKSGLELIINENTFVHNQGLTNEFTSEDNRIISLQASDPELHTGVTVKFTDAANLKGSWSSATTYAGNDIVSFGGTFYFSLQGTNLNHQPDVSSTWWQISPFGTRGHLDTGFGYLVGVGAEIDPLFGSIPGVERVVALDQNPIVDGPVAYHDISFDGGAANHVSHSNAKPVTGTGGVPRSQQHACASNGIEKGNATQPRSDEIVCFRLDQSGDVLVVAPTMASIRDNGGGAVNNPNDTYGRYPKGNLDITGKYFIWTANLFGDRLDAFLVEVPSNLLIGDTNPGPIPVDWNVTDIGDANGDPATHTNGTFTIPVASSEIGGTSDNFRYIYKTLAGNGEIILQVGSLLKKSSTGENQNALERAGVMIRETLSQDSKYAFMALTWSKDQGGCFQTRGSTGVDASACTVFKNIEAPYWVKLQRKSNTLQGYVSADGVKWSKAGKATVTMNTSVLIGLAVTSNTPLDPDNPVTPTEPTLATISRVSVTGNTTSAGVELLADSDTWEYADVGSVAVAGTSTYTSPTYTVKGSGADIGGTSDAFQFLFRSLNYDATIIAKVTAVQNTNAWAKAGVMIRESLDVDAPFAMMMLTRGNGTSFERRLETGIAATLTTPADGRVAPYWVKLVRQGMTFTGYKSSDGVNWVLVGTDTISMSSSAYIGLAVSSHTNSLNTSTFTNVQVIETAGDRPDQTLVFADDFNDGDANGWELYPASGYWSVVNGELKATGPTSPNSWGTQYARVPLPSGTTTWEASIALDPLAPAVTLYGVAIRNSNNHLINGYGVLFVVEGTGDIFWSVVVDGVWEGDWHSAGRITSPTAMHRYTIQMESDATFTILVDGVVQATGISAGATTVWADSIVEGKLFTQTVGSSEILNSRFDNSQAK